MYLPQIGEALLLGNTQYYKRFSSFADSNSFSATLFFVLKSFYNITTVLEHNSAAIWQWVLQPHADKRIVFHNCTVIITIKVPVFYLGWYIMVLMRATSLRGALEGVGPENQDFLGPEMATSAASAIWAQKS
jgi:hypothetical protein